MKNISFSILFMCPFILTLSGKTQQLTDEWRLEKKVWTLPGGESAASEYIYDALGRINKIKHYENKKLQSIQAQFIYDKAERIVSYKEFYPVGVDTLQYLFKYDNLNRLVNAKEVKFKNSGEKRTTLTQAFSYNLNEIKETRVRTSFGGKLTDEITYTLNETGNMIKKTSIEDGKKTTVYVYGEYDDKLNPLAFTGAYFSAQLLSRQNSKEGYWQGNKPAKTSFTYSPAGMLHQATVIYSLDNRPYTHTYKYSYTKIKALSKPAIK